jgi:hypothetical protein
MATETRDVPRTTVDLDGVDIAGAAAALGISPQAVRKRVRRGSLQAYKVDGEWRVILPSVQEMGRAAGYGAVPDTSYAEGYAEGLDAGRATALDTGYAASTPPEATDHGLLDQLKAENEFLRRQVEHQTAIIAGLTQRLPLPALLSGSEVDASTPVPAEGDDRTGLHRMAHELEKDRPWWWLPRWRKRR